MAVDPAWPPFQWQEKDGSFDGFDVQVLTEVANRRGLKIGFRTPDFATILSGKWQGQWDVAPSVTPTQQRSVNLDFPVVYDYTLSALAVHRDNLTIKVPADAGGKKIGVLKGTEFEQYLTRESFDVLEMPPINYKIADPDVVRFYTSGAPFDALAKGDGNELDAVIDSLPTIMAEIKKGRPFKIVGTALMYTPSAIAIEKDDPEFGALLKQTVDAMHVDGTLSSLSVQWFGVDITKP